MATLVNNIVKKTRILTKIPTLVNASIVRSREGNVPRIVTTWSQDVVETAEKVQFERTFVLDERSLRPIVSTPPQPLGQAAVVCYSPSHQKKAVFRKKDSDAKKEQWLLEIWSEYQLTRVLDLSALDKHGAVYSGGDFSSFQWTEDERFLLYIAEKRRPPAVSFFDDTAKEGSERGAESRDWPDWGEQQTGRHQPVVVVLDVPAGELTVLAPPEDVSLGQARWRCSGGALSVVAIAWENQPRRLGVTYCTNRDSHVLELPLQEGGGSGVRLSGAGALSCRSPRVSPDGGAVVWLESAAGGPHHAGARLMRRDMRTGAVTVLQDLVNAGVPLDYSGLYMLELPAECWVSDTQICCSTPAGVHNLVLTVDTTSGQRAQLESRDVAVLAASAQLVVGVRSSLLQPPQLVVKRPADTEFVAVTESASVCPGGTVRPIVWTRPEKSAPDSYTGLLVLPPATDAAAPLVVFPHGGPHSVMVDSWSSHVALFCQLGLAVLLVNYRGSTGAGEDALRSLPGRVGALDVEDCAHAAHGVLRVESARLDVARVAAYGGSHGGFLVTHLSGQHPDLVRAVVARNPVCDVSAMLEGTDIPDWVHVESGEPYDARLLPTPQRLTTMLACSPISHAEQVRAPTLLLVGTADRRVPPYQGLFYVQALRQRGVPTEVRVYDDTHALAKPGVNGDVMVHSATWLCEKLDHSPSEA